MKKYVCIFICFLVTFPSVSFSQNVTDDYSLCYPEGTTWVEGMLDSNNNWLEVTFRFTVAGDTIIDNTAYKIVRRTWEEGSQTGEYTEDKTYYLREDNGLVYYLGAHQAYSHSYADVIYDGSETLRYNYNWENGGMTESSLNKVEKIVLEDGETYDYDPAGKVIRTIGSTTDGLLLTFKGSRTYNLVLLSFSRNGKLIYKNKNDYAIINSISKTFGAKKTSEATYDLQGRRTFSSVTTQKPSIRIITTEKGGLKVIR